MAAKTTQEKMDKIEQAWNKGEEARLMYEWIKTGNLSLGEYKQAMKMLIKLQDDFNEKVNAWG